MKSNLPTYFGFTAAAATCGYILYSLFTSRKLRCEPNSQLEYKEEGILNLFHRDKKPKHISNPPTHVATPMKCKDFAMPEGLPNYGNTCYFNALLQSLTVCSCFGDYLAHYAALSKRYVNGCKLAYVRSLSELLSSNGVVNCGRNEGRQEDKRSKKTLRKSMQRLYILYGARSKLPEQI